MIQLNEQEQFLCQVELPLATRSYAPIPHADLIKTMVEGVNNKGYEITGKRYWQNGTGTQLIGRYELNHTDTDMAMSIGFKNSYDKTMSAGCVAGAQVIICSNGMLKGDFVFKRKHTGTAHEEMLDHIKESIDYSVVNFERLCQSRDTMKNFDMSQDMVNELVGKLFIEQEILRAEQLGIFKKEFKAKDQTFDYGVDKLSAWNIYNLCTYAVDQKTVPTLYVNQHGKLLDVFEDLVGVEQEDHSLILLDE